MKFLTLIMACFLSVTLPAFAANQHLHPKAESIRAGSNNSLGFPGSCEIEIVNRSFDDVRVYGVFDDGMNMDPFNVYSFESPHYISLFYYGYCHDGMDLYIDSFYGYKIFAGYVPRYTTIRIVSRPGSNTQLKAELQLKK